MKPASKLLAGYCALGGLIAATLFAGIYYRFAEAGAAARPWLLPLCIVTACIAWAVGRMRQRAVESARACDQSSRVSPAA